MIISSHLISSIFLVSLNSEQHDFCAIIERNRA